MFRGGPADHRQQLPSHVNFEKLAQKCRNRAVAGPPYLQVWILCFHQPVWKYLGVGWGNLYLCSTRANIFLSSLHKQYSMYCYLPSIHIMLCISSNLELPKAFRRLCVSHMSTAEERFEHLRILVSKMDLRTNPPPSTPDTEGQLYLSYRTVAKWC